MRVQLPAPSHIPVLLKEVLHALAPVSSEVFLDCTAGLGGHASALAPSLGPSGVIVLNDADPANLAVATANVRTANPSIRIVPLHGNFADAPRKMAESRLAADLVLADLGFSSNQIETGERGFSFQRDGPLDMRMNPSSPVTAADLVASASEAELARWIREYGEEPAAGRIARKLVETRRTAPISTTSQLADIVRSVLGRKAGSIDPATKTFQAFRIAVNDELGSLAALLAAIERPAWAGEQSWLKEGARVAIISFHSLEDRLVKRCFASLVAAGKASHIGRGTIEAGEEEININPRSRSAKMRAIRLLH